jgi:branched-chain amino acid transport system substrate-binding protein
VRERLLVVHRENWRRENGVPRVRKIAIVLAAALAIAAIVGASLATAKSARKSAVPSGTFKIGYVESITGRLAFYEPPWGDGVKTAIDLLNAKGGIDGKLKLQLIAEDGKSDPATGAVVARDLVGKGVQFGITPCDQDIGVPAAQVFQRAKIPVVMSCGSGWTFPQVVGDYAFINVFGTAAMGAAQAEFAIKKGWKRACDLSSNDYFYGKNTSDVFEARYKQLGGKIVCHVFYKLTQTDFRSVDTEIASAKPQVVVTTLVLPGATVMLKQLRAQGYKGPMLWSDAGELITGAGAAVRTGNVYFTTQACPTNPPTAAFYRAYKKKTGKTASLNHIATGGDLVNLIAAAIKKAGSTNGTAIRDAFASLKNVAGPSGITSYAGSPLFHVPKKNVYVLVYNKTSGARCVDAFYPKVVPKIK